MVVVPSPTLDERLSKLVADLTHPLTGHLEQPGKICVALGPVGFLGYDPALLPLAELSSIAGLVPGPLGCCSGLHVSQIQAPHKLRNGKPLGEP